jgi:hypothetical protein
MTTAGPLCSANTPARVGDLIWPPTVIRRRRRDQTALDELDQGTVERARPEPEARLVLHVGRYRIAVLRPVAEREQHERARLAEPGEAVFSASLSRHTVHRVT